MSVSLPYRAAGWSSLACLCLLLGACETRSVTASDRVERESGLLMPEAGFRGDRLGVEVDRVVDTGGDRQAIYLSLPFDSSLVDEVEVVDADGRPLVFDTEPRIDPRVDERGTGLRIFLPARNKLEFRVRLIDLPEN